MAINLTDNIIAMKKIFCLSIMLMLTLVVSAQQKEITKFLGIPIDGTKSDMIQKLKEKGFTPVYGYDNILCGEFNGVKSNIHVCTNKNKVYRIMVCDVDTRDQTNTRIRFNNLVYQFQNNPKYMPSSFDKDCLIPENEDIGYEIRINNKRYETVFYQMPQKIDTLAMMSRMKAEVSSKYTQEQIDNPTKEILKDLTLAGIDYMIEDCVKRPVWFIIKPLGNEFYIALFYDNELNAANGEDL